jgi:hypothetical protein
LLPQFEMIYKKLLDTDIAIKTGRNKPALALDLLVMELTRWKCTASERKTLPG